MPEYIELEKALESLQNKYENMYGCNPSFYAGYQLVLENLKRIKSADVAPVVHAKWIQYLDTDEWACSNCEEAQICFDFTPKELGMSYCPNCGAKMDL